MVNVVKGRHKSTNQKIYDVKRKGLRKSSKMFLTAVLVFGLLFVVSCGRGDVPTTTDDPDRIVYVAEYQDMGLGNSGMPVALENDGILYSLVREDTASMTAAKIIMNKTDIADGSQEQVSMFDVDAGETVTAMVYQQGNLVVLMEKVDEAGNSHVLYEVTPDGEKVKETDITAAVKEAGGISISRMSGDGQGNLYIAAETEMYSTIILLLDQAGAVKGKVESAQMANSMFYAGDNLYVYGYGTEITVLSKDDFANGSPGTMAALKGILNNSTFTFAPGGSTGILVNNGVGIYEYDSATGECSKVFDYIESDFLAGTVSLFGIIGDQSFWAVNQALNNYGDVTATEMVRFNATTAAELPEREIIRFNAYNIMPLAYKPIVEFNKSNPRYRIVVEDFTPTDFSEYEAAMLRFNASLLGDERPDIVQVSIGDYKNLIRKGVLEDLYPFMEEDDSFNLDDYLNNIMTIYEEDQKLYGLANGFMIETLVGSAEILGDIERWNIEEMIAFAEQHPDAQLFAGDGRAAMIRLTSRNLERFVNYETGESYFQDDDFIKLLEFAATFKAPEDLEEGTEYLLSIEYVFDVESVQRMESYYNGPITYIGYPTDEGNGIIVSTGLGLGMNADSKVKDGVWEYLSFLLSDEAQDAENGMIPYTFPVKNSAVDLLCEKAMATQYADDGNGNQIEVPKYVFGVEMEPATEEHISQFKDLLERADTLPDGNEYIFTIISEEIDGYFAGQKTAAEVAEIIDNRVQVYLSENQ